MRRQLNSLTVNLLILVTMNKVVCNRIYVHITMTDQLFGMWNFFRQLLVSISEYIFIKK